MNQNGRLYPQIEEVNCARGYTLQRGRRGLAGVGVGVGRAVLKLPCTKFPRLPRASPSWRSCPIYPDTHDVSSTASDHGCVQDNGKGYVLEFGAHFSVCCCLSGGGVVLLSFMAVPIYSSNKNNVEGKTFCEEFGLKGCKGKEIGDGDEFFKSLISTWGFITV